MANNSIETDLYQYLAYNANIAAYVPAGQIYPNFIKSDATFPAISIVTVGRTESRSLNYTAYYTKRVQIDCFAATIRTVKTLENLVLGNLDGYSGQFLGGSNIRVMQCHAANIIDAWDNDSSIYRVTIVFEVMYSQTQSPGPLITGAGTLSVDLTPLQTLGGEFTVGGLAFILPITVDGTIIN